MHPFSGVLRLCPVPLLMALVGCGALKPDPAQQQARDEALLSAAEREIRLASATKPSVDLSFLLSMTYQEAKSISPHTAEMASGARVAAESIETLKSDKDGQPKKIRAKGKVFIDTGSADNAKILCQEAYINGDEAILRGKPILQRGGSVIEGLAEDTIFYMYGTRLRVIGMHRLSNPNTMVASLPDLGPWTGGPNPLLPPLNESSVPTNIRAEMQKAAEAEAILQQNRRDSATDANQPPAPWIDPEPPSAPKSGDRASAPANPGPTSQTTAASSP